MVLTKLQKPQKLKKLWLQTWKPMQTPWKALLKKLTQLLLKLLTVLSKLPVKQSTPLKALLKLLATWSTLLLNNPSRIFEKERAWPDGRALFLCPHRM